MRHSADTRASARRKKAAGWGFLHSIAASSAAAAALVRASGVKCREGCRAAHPRAVCPLRWERATRWQHDEGGIFCTLWHGEGGAGKNKREWNVCTHAHKYTRCSCRPTGSGDASFVLSHRRWLKVFPYTECAAGILRSAWVKRWSYHTNEDLENLEGMKYFFTSHSLRIQ